MWVDDMDLSTQPIREDFDAAAAVTRCRRMRRRILDLSQKLPALHIAPSYSCLELVDTIYFGLMRRGADGKTPDTFLLSKGHGAPAQFAVLEELGIMSKEDLDTCCQSGARLGGHPDYGLPGVEASTGSLGHGLPMALGISLAHAELKIDSTTFVVMSDGELMEGSTWESLLLAPSLNIHNLVLFVDLNDFISRGQTSLHHPNIYPVEPKFTAFGWDVCAVDGHDPAAIFDAGRRKHPARPLAIIARTIKGKGVSFMENQAVWHYRSPNPQEYQQALAELEQ
jgi:transketolase